jgi:hypothetical protein
MDRDLGHAHVATQLLGQLLLDHAAYQPGPKAVAERSEQNDQGGERNQQDTMSDYESHGRR